MRDTRYLRYSKTIARIKLHGKDLKAIPQNRGQDKVVHPPYFFNTIFEIIPMTIRQRKEIEGIETG